MTLGLAFAIVMLLWLVLGIYRWRGTPPGPARAAFGNDALLFVLFLLIGWQLWGPLLHR
jgi:hypothetical protein